MAIVTPGILPASALVESQHCAWLMRWAEFACALWYQEMLADVANAHGLVIPDALKKALFPSAVVELCEAA